MRVTRHYMACSALAALLSAIAAVPAAAADSASSVATACHAPTRLQARLVAKADEGVDNLRDFVFSRRAILQINLMDVASSLDSWRAGTECMRQATATRDAAQVVATISK